MRRRLSVLLPALLYLAFGIAVIVVQARIQDPAAAPWFENLTSALVSGREVGPANDGPYDYRVFRSVGDLAARRGVGDVYNPARFRRFEESVRMKSGSWFYAPTAIPLTALARFSDFGRGFLIWTAILTVMSILVLKGAGIPWPVVIATLVSPAAIWNFNLGQLGLISDALFVASLAWMTDRPAASGIAAGLLTMKPQAGLLLPVVYLARGRFQAIAVALFTFAALVAITLALYGPGLWTAFLNEGLATAHKILIIPFPTANDVNGISIFWMARSFGLGVTVSYAFQAAGAAIAIIWSWLAWRDPGAASWPRIALTTCLAIFVTPYGYTDDLCAFTLGIALLAWHRGRIRPADFLFWGSPVFVLIAVPFIHVLITPLVILAAAIRAQIEMKQDMPDRRRLEAVCQ